MTKRAPWGHVSRRCVYCGQVGPRVIVASGYAHRRCIPKPVKSKSDVRRPVSLNEARAIKDTITLTHPEYAQPINEVAAMPKETFRRDDNGNHVSANFVITRDRLSGLGWWVLHRRDADGRAGEYLGRHPSLDAARRAANAAAQSAACPSI